MIIKTDPNLRINPNVPNYSDHSDGRVIRIAYSDRSLGFALIEILLSISVLVLIVTSLAGAVIYGQESTRMAGARARATLLAEEGLEAVRNIRDANCNLYNGTFGLSTTGNQWSFSGSSDTVDVFNRSINVSEIDVNTKNITSQVTWTQNQQRQGTVSLEGRLTFWQKAMSSSGGPIMMAYSKNTISPYLNYRIWDGSVWTGEAAARNVGSGINYIVLKSARTRDEAILGTLASNGDLYAQVWNGTSWESPTLIANVGTTLDIYRGFDIEYEKNSDRAVIAYIPNSSSVDFSYRIWDGSSWSTPITVTLSPTTGVIRWIELAQNPLNNEIAMIMLDANVDIYGMVWTGCGWNNMGISTIWDTSGSSAIRKSIDVAYEQNSGRAMFIWGRSSDDNQYFRIWDGTNLTSLTNLNISLQGGSSDWVRLVSRPNSNELLYGVQDDSSDLNTRKWNGSTWDTATEHPRHSQGLENATSMGFDIVWETHSSNPGEAWLLMANSNEVQIKQWLGCSPTCWTSASTLGGSDDTSFIRLKADSVTGAAFAGIYEDSSSSDDDIMESHLTNGLSAWSSLNTIWTGATSADPVYFRIDIATP